jgi:putative ABC transport system permease protein
VKQIRIKTILHMAILSMQMHKIRTGLALIGIVIGVAALITTISIGSAAGENLVNQVLSLGSNYMTVQSGTFLTQGKISGQKKKNAVLIGQMDLEAIRQQIPNIKAISPVVESSKNMSYGTTIIGGSLKGGSQDLLKIINVPLRSGLPFSAYQVQTGAKVAILGSRAASDLFDKENPIGKTITIDRIGFIVIGVAEKQPIYQNTFTDPNLTVYVPYTAIWKKLISVGENGYSHIAISAIDKEKTETTVSQLKKLLRFRHGISPGMEDDFAIVDQQELLKQAKKTARTLNIFLISASGIAMLVGGIGIMNIMLVSITERRREIGIRMAIGATPSNIMMQFLSESLILCFIGGFLGILLGLLLPELVTYISGMPTVIRGWSILLSFFTAFATGVTFGLYPAYKASQLNPVDALRSY